MSPRPTINESAFRHYMRVRIGANGPKGRLLKCRKRDNTGFFWKVKLDSGEWAWPDRVILDGSGTHVSTCRECEIPFMSERMDEPLCPTCDSAPQTPSEIRKPLAYLHGARTPVTKPAPATTEQMAEVERLRRELEDESPF